MVFVPIFLIPLYKIFRKIGVNFIYFIFYQLLCGFATVRISGKFCKALCCFIYDFVLNLVNSF